MKGKREGRGRASNKAKGYNNPKSLKPYPDNGVLTSIRNEAIRKERNLAIKRICKALVLRLAIPFYLGTHITSWYDLVLILVYLIALEL